MAGRLITLALSGGRRCRQPPQQPTPQSRHSPSPLQNSQSPHVLWQVSPAQAMHHCVGQHVLPHAAPSVQHCPPAQTRPSAQQLLAPQCFSTGQHGPSSDVTPSSARVPSGQQRTSPTDESHCRSGGQHSHGAASLKIGFPQRFGVLQQLPVPGAALQHSLPFFLQQTFRASSQQNWESLQRFPPHRSPFFFFRFFFLRLASTSSVATPVTSAARPAPSPRTTPRREGAPLNIFAISSNRLLSISTPASKQLPASMPAPARIIRHNQSIRYPPQRRILRPTRFCHLDHHERAWISVGALAIPGNGIGHGAPSSSRLSAQMRSASRSNSAKGLQ